MPHNYDNIRSRLNEINMSKEELRRSAIYHALQQYNPHCEIKLCNLTSMCNTASPDLVRLRSDPFLRNALNNIETYLLTGFCLNDKRIILCFSSDSFKNYHYGTNNSNSFITIKYDQLQYLSYYDEDTIQYWNYNGSRPNGFRYSFYVTVNDNFNYDLFIHGFINNIEAINEIHINERQIIIPQIPSEIRNEVTERYRHKCALIQNRIQPCPCGNNINVDYLDQNNLSYIHLHHLVPKELFVRLFNNGNLANLNSYLIHKPINLIALCMPCHQSIHKINDGRLVKGTFESIITLLENMNLRNEFDSFLQECGIDEDILLNFYLGE